MWLVLFDWDTLNHYNVLNNKMAFYVNEVSKLVWPLNVQLVSFVVITH